MYTLLRDTIHQIRYRSQMSTQDTRRCSQYDSNRRRIPHSSHTEKRFFLKRHPSPLTRRRHRPRRRIRAKRNLPFPSARGIRHLLTRRCFPRAPFVHRIFLLTRVEYCCQPIQETHRPLGGVLVLLFLLFLFGKKVQILRPCFGRRFGRRRRPFRHRRFPPPPRRFSSRFRRSWHRQRRPFDSH